MPSTPHGVPFPADTDLVRDGAQAIEDVATALDSRVLSGELLWGPPGAPDTRLSRMDVATLFTEGKLRAGSYITANLGGDEVIVGYARGVESGILFGAETKLFRDSPGTLKTDGAFIVSGEIFAEGDTGAAGQTRLLVFVSGVGARRVEVGAPDSGGSGYRQLRVTN